MKRGGGVIAAVVLVLASAALAGATENGTAVNFELVGHDPLFGRGMNAAPAVYGNWMYIGNRTDGQPRHPHAGVLVEDISDPTHPFVFGEIGAPDEGNLAETSRELRVWPQQKLLMVMNFGCSAIIHACTSAADAVGSLTPNIKFYDLTGDNAGAPKLISTYSPPWIPRTVGGNPVPDQRIYFTPHEMYLWVDPADPNRALLYYTTPTSNLTRPNLVITDISKARQGIFTDVAQWKGDDLFPKDVYDNNDVRLHSIGVSADGTRAYLAYLGGGFLILDTSDFAVGAEHPVVRLKTPMANRIPSQTAVGTHSAVKIPGSDYVLTTDEVYGAAIRSPVFSADHGCPWGWVRILDVSDETDPSIASEFRQAENNTAYCSTDKGQDPQNTLFTSFSSHNPTALPHLALVTWHSDGLIAIGLDNPAQPSQAGVFKPQPLGSVSTEDPALSLGSEKVVAWSYPIIKNGLIYYIDIRNGLYVVRYTGPHADEVNGVSFLEGNSNLGNAVALDTSVLARHVTAPHIVSPPLPATAPLPSTGVERSAGPAFVVLALALALASRLRRVLH
jgi:hypothetical protein